MTSRLAALSAALRPHLDRVPAVTVDGRATFVLFLSLSDGATRARVVTGCGHTVAEAWQRTEEQLASHHETVRWMRLDWVDAVERSSWGALREHLGRIKRNYFRLGIALDPGFEQAFLEVELNANAMLYGGPGNPAAVLNERNFARYAAQRHGVRGLTFADSDPVWLFTTGGLFVDNSTGAVEGGGETVHPLVGSGLDAGRRKVDRLTPASIESLIRAGSGYLATQVRADGRFHYGYHPCFDRPISSYNALRHASTLYAMLEAWEVTRDPALWAAIERALACLTDQLIRTVTLPGGERADFLVDTGDEIKLGGNALALLALTKHAELTGTRHHAQRLAALATGILHMQDAETGRFAHVLHYPALTVKEAFRIIYYDGEAAFALLRLYAMTGEARLIEAVERAFAHFIAARHWEAHDHWLAYSTAELTQHRPSEPYYRFALDNVRDHIDFVQERITTFPTLLELMMATAQTMARLADDPCHAQLLDGIDRDRFDRALHHRAHYLLNGHFWPELAMFFADPAKIAGSFFIRHHAFRVRIDDVEHYLSGLVAYRRHLLDRQRHAPAPRALSSHPHWTAADVERATGGVWATPPPPDWRASGLCIAPLTMQAGDMVAVRVTDPGLGISPQRLPRLPHRPAALIVGDAQAVADTGLPTLVVEDVAAAVLAMGRYARNRMTGQVVAVTGSAGKTTTVAMTALALSAYGNVGQTRHNANLPAGVAWNLASIPWDAPHTVLELAIGRMARTARLARPDLAIVTNILPAHLEYHKDLATIAARKSAIFDGMAPGGIAVLNRDMNEWERVHMAARSRGLRIIHYGRTCDSDLRLLGYDAATGRVSAVVLGKTLCFPLAAAGEHMALNSLAVLAATSALGHDIAPALALLADFTPAQGRGNTLQVELPGRRSVTLIDDAYNANPGSMEAALAALASRPTAGRRIVVLGEMLELGDDAAAYHAALAPLIECSAIDRVYAVGALFAGFWDALPPDRRGFFRSSPDGITAELVADLADGDTVLIKGSHGTKLHALPARLASAAGAHRHLAGDLHGVH